MRASGETKTGASTWMLPLFPRSPGPMLAAAALHRGQRLAHLTESPLHRGPGLHVLPPCGDARTTVERLCAEGGQQAGGEEHRGRECAVGESEVGSASEAA